MPAEAQAKRRREDKRRRDKFRLNRYQGTETKEQRETRLKKQRERSQKNRDKKTDIEKKLQREEKNRKRKEKRLNESSNQKFWRLMWRRTYRKIGCPYLSVEFEYHRSTHQYGIDEGLKDFDETTIQLSDVGLKTAFRVFDELLELALRGQLIPAEKFKFFAHYGIYLPANFFTNYVDDVSFWSN